MKTVAWFVALWCIGCGGTRAEAPPAGAAEPTQPPPPVSVAPTQPVPAAGAAPYHQPSQLPPGYAEGRNVPRFPLASEQEIGSCGPSRVGRWAFIMRSCTPESPGPACRYLVKMDDSGVELRPVAVGSTLRGIKGQSKAGDTFYDIEHGRGSLLVDGPRNEATLELGSSRCMGTLVPPP